MTHDVLAAFGANLGDGETVFRKIEKRLARDFDGVRTSSLLRTRAVTLSDEKSPGVQTGVQTVFPREPEPDYWNAVIQMRVPEEWKPERFLKYLLALEKEFGRKRTGSPEEHWSARTADLDLLLWDDLFLDAAPHLVLPHPMMPWRRFVLEPACELSPERIHPLTGQSLAEMLSVLKKRERPDGMDRMNGMDEMDGMAEEASRLVEREPFLLWDSMEAVPQELLELSRKRKCPLLARRWVCRNGGSPETFRKIIQLIRRPPS